jgi:hypothetical protein
VPRLPRALGQCLAVGLEFELAADILRTAVTPTWNDIEQLIAIAALRTGLNYFLEREIRRESRWLAVRACALRNDLTSSKTTGTKTSGGEMEIS